MRAQAIATIVFSCLCWVMMWGAVWSIFAYLSVTLGAVSSIFLLQHTAAVEHLDYVVFRARAPMYATWSLVGGSFTIIFAALAFVQGMLGIVVFSSAYTVSGCANSTHQNTPCNANVVFWANPLFFVVSLTVFPLMVVQGSLAIDLGVKLRKVVAVLNTLPGSVPGPIVPVALDSEKC